MDKNIDDKDIQILTILKDHADYSTRQIAKKTLLPATTINNRIRKLKAHKVIRKITVDIDPDKVDRGFKAYVLISANIQTLKEKKKTQYDVVKELRKLDCIESADVVTGGTDIIATIRVKDVKEFDGILLGKIQLIEGIDKTQSLVVIH